MRYLLLLFIKFYQFFISPWTGRNCIYFPTCSEYAKESLINHGIIKGLFLTTKRIFSCHPFASGGYDPVPEIKNIKKSK